MKKVTFCESVIDNSHKSCKDYKPRDKTSSKDNPTTDEQKDKKNHEWIQGYLRLAFGLSDPESLRVLDEVSVEGVARYIKDNKCKNIITMAGAGISTSAGVPDYRSQDGGLYDKEKEQHYTIDHFNDNPDIFYKWLKKLFPENLKPTLCHYFIRLLHEKGLLLRHYTQNIDALDQLAGLPREQLAEFYGSITTSYCMECNQVYSQDWLKEKILTGAEPECLEENCKGIVKPDILFHGEQFPPWLEELSSEDFCICDLLIILGASVKEQPFRNLSSKVWVNVPRLYINLEPPDPPSANMMMALMFGHTFDFDSEERYRDVFKQATCDDGCRQLADLIGWGEELDELFTQNGGCSDPKEIGDDISSQKQNGIKSSEESQEPQKKEEKRSKPKSSAKKTNSQTTTKTATRTKTITPSKKHSVKKPSE
ncbi:hypothetical protein SNE40_010939 [Patella caerulea]|uniref:Deacetylase sirtuin-type domain-containing protein n=1 Tax=Patella caerulea TaxID=87958 RepID=A0AAN8Q0T2_PATCE